MPKRRCGLGPHDTLAYVYLLEKADGLFIQSRYEEAAEFFKRSIAANPEYAPSYIMLTASLALSGHDAEAAETLPALSRAAARHCQDAHTIEGAPTV